MLRVAFLPTIYDCSKILNYFLIFNLKFTIFTYFNFWFLIFNKKFKNIAGIKCIVIKENQYKYLFDVWKQNGYHNCWFGGFLFNILIPRSHITLLLNVIKSVVDALTTKLQKLSYCISIMFRYKCIVVFSDRYFLKVFCFFVV